MSDYQFEAYAKIRKTELDKEKKQKTMRGIQRQVNNGEFPQGICRLWESETYFVVLGLSKKVHEDVHFDACLNDQIPILKRCSGGGTVLQGPGCFNYSYILPINFAEPLESLSKTTHYILNLVKRTLMEVINDIEIKGISDLAIQNIKFSGNAQRRLKNAILFHGTILYDFDLSLISKYLKNPPIQPDYRNHRSHEQFIKNINLSQADLNLLFSKTMNTSLNPLDINIPDHTLEKYQEIRSV